MRPNTCRFDGKQYFWYTLGSKSVVPVQYEFDEVRLDAFTLYCFCSYCHWLLLL